MKKRLLILAIAVFACSPAFAQAPPPPPPTIPEEEPVLPPEFRPLILDVELQRAITVGNPPQKPRWFHPQLPVWFKRPVEIPKSYPLREQDGEQFLR